MKRLQRALSRLAADFLVPVALGGLATLGFAPFGWYGLTLLALIGLLALWWGASARRAAWRGWLFGVGHFATGLYWVYISIHFYGGGSVALAAALVGLLVAGMALFPAAVGALAGAMGRLPRLAWALLFVPGAWLLGELVRAHLGTGFPWLSLGYSLIDAPVTSLAPIIGVYGLGALMVAAAGSLWLLFTGGLAARALAVALIVAAPVTLWLVPPPTAWTESVGEPLAVAILQGNVPQDEKWLPENLPKMKQRYRELAASVQARLVIWPEAAIASAASMQQEYLHAIAAAAAARGRTELIGILVYNQFEQEFYNAVLAVGVETGRYYKHHLVPFGEYFPLPGFIKRWISAIDMRYGIAPAPARQPLIEVDGVALGISICFEDAFPRAIRKSLPAAEVLVNVTNDAWFADSIAPHQHLQIARMRALEAGRPLLRAANTGISAVIAPTGQVRERAPQFEVATIEATVQPRSGATPYVRYGEAPLWILAIVFTAGGLVLGRQRI